MSDVLLLPRPRPRSEAGQYTPADWGVDPADWGLGDDPWWSEEEEEETPIEPEPEMFPGGKLPELSAEDISKLPAEPPPGWSGTGLPWPPFGAPTQGQGDDAEPTVEPPAPVPGGLPPPPGGDVVPAGATSIEKKTEEKFWTPGKIAVAAGLGAVGVGLVVYLATRKKRRNNPRRRRRARRAA